MIFSPKKYPNCARGHQYAMDIVEGKILASRYVIGACKRYLREVEDGYSEEWYFSPERAERFLRLVQKFKHVIGKGWSTENITFEPWQCWIWMNIMGFIRRDNGFRRFRIAHVEVARGNGKALSLDTKVQTPDRGLVNFGDLKVGDKLYSRDGKVCSIIGRNKTHFPQAYKMNFSDGTEVICSDNHLWFTSSKKERGRQARHQGRIPRKTTMTNTVYESVRSTEEIFNTQTYGSGWTCVNYSTPLSEAIKGQQKNLGVDPYILGYWLGNGESKSGRVHFDIRDSQQLLSNFKSRGFEVSKLIETTSIHGTGCTLYGLTSLLREIKVLNNKNIPEEYYTSSIQQRMELVRGLLDSDGTCSPAGVISFAVVKEKLAKDFRRLLATLGYKSSIQMKDISHLSDINPTCYTVTFTPKNGEVFFNLPRKQERVDANQSTRTWYSDKRYIQSVEKLEEKIPMFCIEVDSEDSSFLITDQLLPTHNSTMASTAALFFLVLDNPNGNQISTAATKKDQARIVLDAARAMAKENPSFINSKGVRVLAHSIVHNDSNSIMRALSAQDGSLDGLNDVLAVLDELHAMKEGVFYTIMSGMSKRKDSLTLCITTAGSDIDSIGFSQSNWAKKVCLGEEEDDRMFAAVYTLDEKTPEHEADDPFEEKNWIKANPNYGVSVDPVNFEAEINKAKNNPQDLPNFKIKHLNMWISEFRAYFSMEAWDACADPTLKIEDFEKKAAYLGLDLSQKIDLASFVACFKKDGKFYFFDKTYLPQATFDKENKTLYKQALANGFLNVTKGEAINNDIIRADLEALAKKIRVQSCNYDTWSANEMAQKLSSKIEMVQFAKTVANFSEAMKSLDAEIRKGNVVHNGSPLFRWCLSNVIAKEDANQNVFPRKSHNNLKIDIAISALMAYAGWIHNEDKTSVYEERGIRVV